MLPTDVVRWDFPLLILRDLGREPGDDACVPRDVDAAWGALLTQLVNEPAPFQPLEEALTAEAGARAELRGEILANLPRASAWRASFADVPERAVAAHYFHTHMFWASCMLRDGAAILDLFEAELRSTVPRLGGWREHQGWLLSLALAAAQLERPELAERALDLAMAADVSGADVWMEIGHVREQLDQLDAAEEAWQLALAMNPGLGRAWLSLAALWSEDPERADQVAAACRRARDVDPELAADSHYAMSQYLVLTLGDRDGGLLELEQAVAADKEHWYAHTALAALYEELGRYQEAVDATRWMLELYPQDRCGWARLGEMLAENLFDVVGAEKAFRIGAEELDDSSCWVGLGVQLQDYLFRPDEAMAAYQRAAELDADCGVTSGNLAQTLLDLGRPDEARAVCDEAMRDGETSPWVLKARVRAHLLDGEVEAAHALLAAAPVPEEADERGEIMLLRGDFDDEVFAFLAASPDRRHQQSAALAAICRGQGTLDALLPVRMSGTWLLIGEWLHTLGQLHDGASHALRVALGAWLELDLDGLGPTPPEGRVARLRQFAG